MADTGEVGQRLVQHDDMTEEVVDVDALEVVRISLSEDNHRPTGSRQSVDELRTEAVVVAGRRRADYPLDFRQLRHVEVE